MIIKICWKDRNQKRLQEQFMKTPNNQGHYSSTQVIGRQTIPILLASQMKLRTSTNLSIRLATILRISSSNAFLIRQISRM